MKKKKFEKMDSSMFKPLAKQQLQKIRGGEETRRMEICWYNNGVHYDVVYDEL
jgi:hypothetical protein